MAESRTRLELTLDLLQSSGYINARETECSASERLVDGLVRCIFDALYPDNHQFDVASIETLTFEDKVYVKILSLSLALSS